MNAKEIMPVKKSFLHADEALEEVKKNMGKTSENERFFLIGKTILSLIEKEKTPCFLLPALLSFLANIQDRNFFKENYRLSSFEFFLNHFSGLSWEENRLIRGKIMGKYLPRYAFQKFFPVGKKEGIFGTHIVTGHVQPDPDALVSSLLGWMDAYSFRVGTGLHHWQLPGGAPNSPVTTLLEDYFLGVPMSFFARTSLVPRLFARDLLATQSVFFATPSTSLATLRHGGDARAIVVRDEEGFWIGDWREQDVEPVGQLLSLVKSFFRSFEIFLFESLFSLFQRPSLNKEDAISFLKEIFQFPFFKKEKHFLTEHQVVSLDRFLKKIFCVKKGLNGSLQELGKGLLSLGLSSLSVFEKNLEKLGEFPLFDEKGNLISDRMPFFSFFEWFLNALGKTGREIDLFLDRMSTALLIKKEVLGIVSPFITLRTEPEGIAQKMENRDFLTVNLPVTSVDGEEKGFVPLGVVFNETLQKKFLGSISLRDFSNIEEVDISPNLAIISVVDHHKIALKTDTPPVTLIGDVQSSNTLVAEEHLAIYEKAQSFNSPYFIHKDRAFFDAFFALHAILDDTDLLTKVTYRDVDCSFRLLSQLVESRGEKLSFSFNDIEEDALFVEKAKKQLLDSKEMKEFLKDILTIKKSQLEENIKDTLLGKKALFSDTKIQNRHVHTSQIKLFPNLRPLFFSYRQEIREAFLELAKEVHAKNPKVTFFILLISTLSEIEQETPLEEHAKDEWWLFTLDDETGQMERFFVSFFISQEEMGLSFELRGPKTLQEKLDLFRWPFVTFIEEKETACVTLSFQAGALNSRKTAVSPFLPSS